MEQYISSLEEVNRQIFVETEKLMTDVNKTEFGNNFIQKMKEVGYVDCSDPSGFSRMFFESCFADNLNNEEHVAFAKEHGIDVEKYCAALAQLQTIKRIGASNDGPYDIKLFLGFTDEEIDIFIDKGPLELVKRAFAANFDQRKRISERVKRESGSVS